MSYLILGASSGLGRELANILAKNLNNLIIISRDERDLKTIKSDLEARFKIVVKYFVLDASSFDEVKKLLNETQGIMFPIGMVEAEDKISNDMSISNSLIQANIGAVAYFLSKIFPVFLKKNNGVIVGFGSVSSAVGREVNTVYAASKRGLDSLFESLALTASTSKIKIQYYTIGYLDSNLAYGRKLLLPKGSVNKLAKIVYKNLKKNYKKIYYPSWWVIIVIMINILPFSLLKNIYKLLKNKN